MDALKVYGKRMQEFDSLVQALKIFSSDIGCSLELQSVLC